MALEDADIVLQSLDETEQDLVLASVVAGDAVPVTFDHLSEFLEGFEPLPTQRFSSRVEALSGPCFAAVVPKLIEAFLEQIGGVQSFVVG